MKTIVMLKFTQFINPIRNQNNKIPTDFLIIVKYKYFKC